PTAPTPTYTLSLHDALPILQNAAFRASGLDWRYVKLPVPPERFEELVRALPASGYRGANVTIPHKAAALRVADSASPAARAIGADRKSTRLNSSHLVISYAV